MNEEPLKDKVPGNDPETAESVNEKTESRWPKAAALLFFCAMIAGIAFALYERAQADQSVAHYAQMNTALIQAQNQLEGLTSKLNALAAHQQTPKPATPSPAAGQNGKHQAGKAYHARRRRAEDPRWKKMQAQLADQQIQIASTQQSIDQARTELESQLNSTHDELSGSIARSHDELVALEKRGERNFFEFDLTKSKQFQRVGPISIALRKANTKHLFCDLNLLVDDNLLNKKHVILYEPVQFYPADYGQPLQIVIYKIGKNEASGYVSAPKYRQSELSSTQPAPGNMAASAPPATPVAATNSADLARRPAPQP
jgi:hypothetical protein